MRSEIKIFVQKEHTFWSNVLLVRKKQGTKLLVLENFSFWFELKICSAIPKIWVRFSSAWTSSIWPGLDKHPFFTLQTCSFCSADTNRTPCRHLKDTVQLPSRHQLNAFEVLIHLPWFRAFYAYFKLSGAIQYGEMWTPHIGLWSLGRGGGDT